MGFGIGQPTERELTLLWNVRLFESLIPFAELFEEPGHGRSNDNRNHRGPVAQMVEQGFCKPQVAGSIPGQDLQIKKKNSKPEFDWRVVVANAKGGLRCPQLARNRP